jgi:type IV secretory pathway VirB10-like protein
VPLKPRPAATPQPGHTTPKSPRTHHHHHHHAHTSETAHKHRIHQPHATPATAAHTPFGRPQAPESNGQPEPRSTPHSGCHAQSAADENKRPHSHASTDNQREPSDSSKSHSHHAKPEHGGQQEDADLSEEAVRRMSVGALKRTLASMAVDFSLCVEKDDLTALLLQSIKVCWRHGQAGRRRLFVHVAFVQCFSLC